MLPTHCCGTAKRIKLCLLRATCRVNVTGIAVQQWVSVARELLPDEFLQAPKSHMHGGPPVVLVGSSASGTGKPYYLGVMHYWHVSGQFLLLDI